NAANIYLPSLKNACNSSLLARFFKCSNIKESNEMEKQIIEVEAAAVHNRPLLQVSDTHALDKWRLNGVGEELIENSEDSGCALAGSRYPLLHFARELCATCLGRLASHRRDPFDMLAKHLTQKLARGACHVEKHCSDSPFINIIDSTTLFSNDTSP
ncbi:hypothetical protein X801_06170, partial [Opisthorchis viverrini]